MASKRVKAGRSYFTEKTITKVFLYSCAAIFVSTYSIVASFEPWISLPCDRDKETIDFDNHLYPGRFSSSCRSQGRYLVLLFATRDQCSFVRRLVSATVLGGLIGWERRQCDRPAGIRTMSLVATGASLFTVSSTFAFSSGPMGWDSSRVSAAIPSGVGFLGAGLIYKESVNHDFGSSQVVHGLTTAASVWLSAAVGIACGGELYFAAIMGVAITLMLLRFGPRHSQSNDDFEQFRIPGTRPEDNRPDFDLQNYYSAGSNEMAKTGSHLAASHDGEQVALVPQNSVILRQLSVRSSHQHAALASVV